MFFHICLQTHLSTEIICNEDSEMHLTHLEQQLEVKRGDVQVCIPKSIGNINLFKK